MISIPRWTRAVALVVLKCQIVAPRAERPSSASVGALTLHLHSNGQGRKLDHRADVMQNETRMHMMPDMLSRTHAVVDKILQDLANTRKDLDDNGKFKESMLDAMDKSRVYSKSVPEYHADAEHLQKFIKQFRAQTVEDNRKLTEQTGELDTAFSEVTKAHQMPVVASTFRVEHSRVQSPWHGPQSMQDLHEKIRKLEEELRMAKAGNSVERPHVDTIMGDEIDAPRRVGTVANSGETVEDLTNARLDEHELHDPFVF
mmetsp:Transcript_48873/g.77166  ORF Transcript_48873/g.77166 Transcript_48873/m.77166 type:complete len:258 (-) Transcript_48873:194-967(-)